MSAKQNGARYGWLCEYSTGNRIRPATEAELSASLEAASVDGGGGVFKSNGRNCYVEGGEQSEAARQVRDQ